MDRFCLKNYPKGVPADIDWRQYSSLVQLLDEAFAKQRDRDAYVRGEHRLSSGLAQPQAR